MEDAKILNLVSGETERGLLCQEKNKGSSKYSHIKTEDVVAFFERKGFTKVGVSAKKRDNNLQQFHVAVMEDRSRTFHNGYARIIIGNDYSCKVMFKLSAGFFNTICANGMVSGESIYEFKRKHKGIISLDELLENEYSKIAAAFEQMERRITKLKETVLTAKQKFRIGYAAIRRGGIRTDSRVIDFRDYFKALRPEEEVDNGWTFMNIIQEKLMRTGIKTIEGNNIQFLKDNRKRLEVNQYLWDKIAA